MNRPPDFMEGLRPGFVKKASFSCSFVAGGKMLVAKKRYNKNPRSLFAVHGRSKGGI
jgi:hypothetical protein